MKKSASIWILSLATVFFFSGEVLSQEQVEVSVKVKKDGRVVQDTTYHFEDADDAKHAIKMMELVGGDDEHMEHISYNYTTTHPGSGEVKKMVFISEDGKQTEITEFSGDSAVWVSEEQAGGKHVMVMKSEDGNTFDILVDEDFEDGDVVMKKEVKVIVTEDDEASWTVIEGDDVDAEGAKVKVIVIKEGDDVDVDHEVEHDTDIEKDIEVKVKKK